MHALPRFHTLQVNAASEWTGESTDMLPFIARVISRCLRSAGSTDPPRAPRRLPGPTITPSKLARDETARRLTDGVPRTLQVDAGALRSRRRVDTSTNGRPGRQVVDVVNSLDLTLSNLHLVDLAVVCIT